MKIVALGGVVVLAVVIAACNPAIPYTPPPDAGAEVVLGFDPGATPPVIPLPNDLAISRTTGLLTLPADAGSAALNEFIATYLDTLNGFPTAFPGSVAVQGGNLDPATVNGNNMVVVDVGFPDGGVPTGLDYQSATHTLAIIPPAGGWIKGHRYLAAALTGVGAPGTSGTGLRDTNGNPVVASPAWLLVSSPDPLVTCDTQMPPVCMSTTSLLTTEQAVQLEPLRLSYKPIIDGIVQYGVPRANIALLWTFGITSQPEATFDPLGASPVIPFPNDLLRSPTTGKVTLPIPPDAGVQLIALYTGLNTLDGFSTSAPVVSCNSTVLNAIEPGLIDPATLAAGGAGFVALSTTAHTPQINICLNCASSPLPDGGGPQTSPQRLQFVPTVPLDETTPYAAFMTTAMKDTAGIGVVPSQTFAVLRLTHPVYDGTHSTLPFLDDATAASAEIGRFALAPLLDGLSAHGVPRSALTLAWAFTTETTVSALKGLHDYAGNPMIPKTPLPPLVDITAPTLAAMTTAGLPSGAIGKVFFGEIVLEFLLTGPFGTLNPTGPMTIRTPLLLTLPATPAPAGGYPVTIYGHGLTGARTNALAIADAIAGGAFAPVPDATPRATIAIDTVWHGARTSCTGSAIVLPAGATDDAACADPTTQKCDEQLIGKCIARDPTTRAPCDPSILPIADLTCDGAHQGFCLTDALGAGLLPDGGSLCAGGEFLAEVSDGQPVISGWNMIRIDNFFAFRDNFRYPVTDLSVLRAVIAQDTTVAGSLNAQLAAQAVGTLSTSDVNYIGQSLGAFLGMNYSAVATEISTVVLAPPGGNLPLIGLTSPAFKPYTDAYLAALAAQGILAGTPQFDDLFAINQWILDPSDPVNSAWNVLNSSLPGVNLPDTRKAFVQYIDQDEVIPNPTTQLVIAAFQKSGPTPAPAIHFFSAATDPMPPVGHRHAFLVNYANPQTTAKAQSEAVKFLNTGTYP